jgi:hypothetical protein
MCDGGIFRSANAKFSPEVFGHSLDTGLRALVVPGDPDTPTVPTTSSPTLIGKPPDIASTRLYCSEPTEAGSFSIRLTKTQMRLIVRRSGPMPTPRVARQR